MTKKFSLKYLALAAVFAVVLTSALYYGSWPQDYESYTAQKKMDYLWKKINEDHSMGSFPGFLGQMKLANPEIIGGLSLMTPGERVSDQFEEGRIKAIHSVGMIAKGKLDWDKDAIKKLGLTGGFTESPDLLMRFSSGTVPSSGIVPNFVMKHLRNGVPSGNLFAGHGLKPQTDPSFFLNTLASHVPNRHGGFSKEGLEAAMINVVFTKGPEYHGITGASEFAHYTSDGKEAKPIKAPFTMVYNPTPEIQKQCKGKSLDGDNFGCLKDIKEGTVLYTVWCVMEPKATVTQADVHYIGQLKTVSKFVTSKFADEQLHFKHVFQPEEAKMWNHGWYEKTNSGEFMDTEGPEKYKPFCQGKNKRRRRLVKNTANY